MSDETHIGPEYFHMPVRGQKPWVEKSRAFWALRPTGTIVVFVHGWSGDATRTWEHFVDLWPPKWEGCDLVFYGYDSLSSQADENAGYFREFLEAFLSNPVPMINATMIFLLEMLPNYRRSEKFTCNKVVIIAHSLGAVIARRALLDLERSPNGAPSWLASTELALFAPAHNGSPWAEAPAKLASSVRGAVLGGISLRAIPSILSLHKDSNTIKNLHTHTVEMVNVTKKGKSGMPHKASKVVFPEKERVVYSGEFGCDGPCQFAFVGRFHSDVCKPSGDWQEPIEFLDGVI